MKYFLGLSSTYSVADTLRHTFAFGDDYQLSELRAFLAAHYGATYDHVAVYANGRTALSVAIKAVAERDSKVVITSLTCYAVVQAVREAGCVPIFADVDPKTLHFGKEELEKAISGEQNIKAVIVQNNLGHPADIAGIEAVAKAHKLAIIEDLAHCTGMKYADGREAGTVGRVAALSFGKGKSIDTVTGGAVVFTNPLDTPVEQPEKPPVFKDNFRARFYPLFSAMIRGLYYIHPKVGKYLTAAMVRIHAIKRSAEGNVDKDTRLTYWQCRLALRQLKMLPHGGRKPLRDFYLVERREHVLKELEVIGCYFSDIWYTTPVAPERYYKKADFHPEECPVATRLADQIINLPTHYEPAEMKPALKVIKQYLIEKEEPKTEDELFAEELLTEAEKKAKIRAEKAERSKAKKAEKAERSKAKKAEKKAKKSKEPEKTEEPEKAENAEEPEKTEEPEKAENAEELEKTEEKSSATRANEHRPEESLVVSPTPVAETTKPAAKGNATMRQAPRKLTDREKLKLELESGKKEGPSVI